MEEAEGLGVGPQPDSQAIGHEIGLARSGALGELWAQLLVFSVPCTQTWLLAAEQERIVPHVVKLVGCASTTTLGLIEQPHVAGEYCTATQISPTTSTEPPCLESLWLRSSSPLGRLEACNRSSRF